MSDKNSMERYEHMIEQERSGSSGWPEWKKILVSLAVMAALCGVVMFFNVPNPNMILVTGLVIFTSMFGFPSGVACGAAMVVYSMWFFSENHSFVSFTPLNLEKMGVILLGVVLNIIFVGQLKKAEERNMNAMVELNEMLKEDNAALERASMVDALTGLRNRYGLRRDYASYENQVLHVLMLDVDDFKDINDKYGHNTGDYVLRHVGGILLDLFGEECCYRYGGDEFLVIKKSMDEKTFGSLTASLLDRVKKTQLDGEDFPVCVSGGFVFGSVESPSDLRLMFRQADNQLYEAKKVGKNRVIGERYRHSIDDDFPLRHGNL